MAIQRPRENLDKDKHHPYQTVSIYPLSLSSILTPLCISPLLVSEINSISVCLLSLTEYQEVTLKNEKLLLRPSGC